MGEHLARIAYILLCHKDVDAIISQVECLTALGDRMSIHLDGNAPPADYARLLDACAENPNVAFPKRRVNCGWGEWSLVDATLEALSAAEAAFPDVTHFFLISGDCMPIKSSEYVHSFLDARDVDYIECHDFLSSDWIKTGFKEERLVYRHWFNERSQPRLFYGAYNLQRRLGLTRQVPKDLRIMIGSQWWCLRRRTVESILAFCNQRKDVMRFFRTTWIPDETFFQTLTRHLVPTTEIDCRSLTFLMFSDYGMPVVFYNDHYDMLLGQTFMFARKISGEARELKRRLSSLYLAESVTFETSDEGRNLYTFLAGRGRIGERFAPRFWQRETTIGRERTLLIVTCKKWHVAKRLLARIGALSNVPCIEYLFDEEATPLPDLGGLQATREKRARHRRALMRMLFEFYETDRMTICIDPSNIDLLRDFYTDKSETRLLEIECQYSDEYLQGHAKRVGLAGEHTSDGAFRSLLPTIRNDLSRESELIRDAEFPEFYRIRERSPAAENAVALADFLSLQPDQAHQLLDAPHIFAD